MKRITSAIVASFSLFAAAAGYAGPVDINTADAATLAAELTGVGPALARAIVEDRDRNGRFNRPEDLTRVSGVGMSIIRNNREYILVESTS